MGFKHIYISLIFRIVLLMLFSGLSVYLIFEVKTVLFGVLAGVFALLMMLNILHLYNQINRWISFFLLGIENEDTSLKIPQKTGNKTIDEIFKGVEHLNDIFKLTKIEISSQEQYFKSILNQSVTGLFSINEKGRIININPAAEKLTGLLNFQSVSVLHKIDPALPDFIQNTSGSNKPISSVFENQYGQKLLFKITSIKTNENTLKLIAVSDITQELDHSEVDAWIKLARTLAHEIMNNITPITTLSNVILGYFKNNQSAKKPDEITQNTINNAIKGLEVIEERSAGLLSFVENYRKFTKLPEPHFSNIDLSSIIKNALIVMETYEGFKDIEVKLHLPESSFCITDEHLILQVLINLLKNSFEAMQDDTSEKKPTLFIHIEKQIEITKLTIANNGPQIQNELREQIFVPFYTTKEQGSGIGLSLSKQIMIKLGGDIVLLPQKDKLTQFQLTIPS